VGAFASWPSPNDIYYGRGVGFMHCCSGNETRAIYYLWDHILKEEDGRVRVNLLLNRASGRVDVESYIPYEGRVDVRVKEACELEVRIPEWGGREGMVCTVNGETQMPGWNDRYAQVGAVKPGDVVTLAWPIAERTVQERIWGVDFTLVIKGNDVVFIDPPGKNYPFYQRAHYRDNEVRWVRRRRFVASDLIAWR
jgi:hypothetical protein